MSLRAGKLRHRVTVQQKSVTRSSTGAEVVTWTDVKKVWASIEPLRGREYLDGKQIHDEVTTQIRMRYRSGVVPEMRITWDSHIYDIVSVVEFEMRHAELQLMCREIT